MAVKITLLIWVFTGIVTSMYLLYKTPKITRSMEITGIAKGGLILLFAIFTPTGWRGGWLSPPRKTTLILNVYLFLAFG